MDSFQKTCIVFNDPSKILGLPPFYYRYRTCDTELNGNTPADQYQKLKLIQNTVRVPASLYVANLAPLTAYKKPVHDGVCWNQMSDRPVPSVQRATIPTGSSCAMNRRHTSVTSSRPGCQTPGGVGCDIKHNSYDRYLNRLKGKGPLKRGVIPPIFGVPSIPYNPAYPIQGAKTMKTSIVTGCDCPSVFGDQKLYNNPLYYPEPAPQYGFAVGQYVYAIQTGNTYYSKAQVTSINGNLYTIQFVDTGYIETVPVYQLKIYYPCNQCNDITSKNAIFVSNLPSTSAAYGVECVLP